MTRALSTRRCAPAPTRWCARASTRCCALALALAAFGAIVRAADPPLPDLTQTVNDFAHVIDGASAQKLDQLSRTLKAATGDVIVVATVPTVEPYADIREYAVKLFENHGRGIGDKGKDNGMLMLVAVKERKVWIEVGYGLEPWITDGFSGETSRDYMVPEFRNGRYGAGLVAGAARIAGRIAQGRNVALTGVEVPAERPGHGPQIPFGVILSIMIAIFLFSRRLGPPGLGMRRWGGGGWSGWSSGVGSFGGSGGGFGGGFGGFGGGGSGGGGGGASW
jgi:uncharacterized protein